MNQRLGLADGVVQRTAIEPVEQHGDRMSLDTLVIARQRERSQRR